MDKIKEIAGKMIQKKYLPFWFFAGIQIIYHLMMREGPGTDAMWFFRNQLDAYSLKDYLTIRYQVWSSRIVIEAVLVYVSRHLVLWKVLDTFAWILFVILFAAAIPGEKRERINWLVVSMVLIYPLKDLDTAGWIATTTNYIWPLALGMFVLTGVSFILQKKKLPLPLFILSLPAMLYAANAEQMCAVICGICFVAILYCIFFEKRKVSTWWQLIVWIVFGAGELLFILTCPGNSARTTEEIRQCMPNFKTYNVIDKLNLGFVDTIHHMISSENLLFLMFAVLLMVLVFLKTKEFVFRLAGILPVMWTVLLTFFGDAFERNFVKLSSLFNLNEIVNGSNYQLAYSYLPLLVYTLVLLCALVSISIISTSWTEFLGYCCLLGIGLASRVIMGFTPTIFVSQERTFLYLYVTIIAAIIFMVQRNIKLLLKHKNIYETLKMMTACVLVLSIVNGLMAASAI
ncbi:MAG: hypothetical protein UHU19_16695 [Lachnospiraceae bacterium]|nr:hypothetical protein [Lachnospiraceae bacterium]